VFAPLQSAVSGMVVMALFHDFVTIEVVVWWWALTLGLIEALQRAAEVGERAAPDRVFLRYVRGFVLAGIVLWGCVQPAWARWVWWPEVKDVALLARAVAAEPWYDAPLEWQTRSLLDEEAWTWPMAAEALATGRHAVRIHSGASRLWVLLGQVHYRIIVDFGPWPESVSEAREAFARASELEPYQPWPWLEWARLERGLGNLDESALLVRRALDVEPHAIRARLFLARVELDRGNVRLAREALESARLSSALRKRLGLKTYEKELLAGPAWQFRELEEALR
jgi:cytochrome c-type biogenesis protein CcmH/NrfG